MSHCLALFSLHLEELWVLEDLYSGQKHMLLCLCLLYDIEFVCMHNCTPMHIICIIYSNTNAVRDILQH